MRSDGTLLSGPLLLGWILPALLLLAAAVAAPAVEVRWDTAPPDYIAYGGSFTVAAQATGWEGSATLAISCEQQAHTGSATGPAPLRAGTTFAAVPDASAASVTVAARCRGAAVTHQVMVVRVAAVRRVGPRSVWRNASRPVVWEIETSPPGQNRFVRRSFDSVGALVADNTRIEWQPTVSTPLAGVSGAAYCGSQPAVTGEPVTAFAIASADLQPKRVCENQGFAITVHYSPEPSAEVIPPAPAFFPGPPMDANGVVPVDHELAPGTYDFTVLGDVHYSDPHHTRVVVLTGRPGEWTEVYIPDFATQNPVASLRQWVADILVGRDGSLVANSYWLEAKVERRYPNEGNVRARLGPTLCPGSTASHTTRGTWSRTLAGSVFARLTGQGDVNVGFKRWLRASLRLAAVGTVGEEWKDIDVEEVSEEFSIGREGYREKAELRVPRYYFYHRRAVSQEALADAPWEYDGEVEGTKEDAAWAVWAGCCGAGE